MGQRKHNILDCTPLKITNQRRCTTLKNKDPVFPWYRELILHELKGRMKIAKTIPLNC